MKDIRYYIDNMRVHPVSAENAAIPSGEAVLTWDEGRRCPTLLVGQSSVPLVALEFVHPRSERHEAIPASRLEGILRQGEQRLAPVPTRAYDSQWEKLWNDVFPYPPEQLRAMQESNREFVTSLVRELGIGKNSRVLELACGHGWFADLMADHAGFVCATDLSLPRTIKTNPNYHKVRFFVSDMLKLPKLRGQFDFIFQFACSVAERETNFLNPEWQGLAGTIRDLLKPGGHLYWIQMSNNSRRPSNAGFQVHLPAPTLVEQFFSRIGRVLRVRTLGYTSFLVRREDSESPASRPSTVKIQVSRPDNAVAMLALVSEIGDVALHAFDRSVELVGPLAQTVAAYYGLRFIYHVSGPIFCVAVPSGRAGRLVILVSSGPGKNESFFVYGNSDREGGQSEARRFRRIALPLTACVMLCRWTRSSDVILFPLVQACVSLASACRASLRSIFFAGGSR